MKNISKLMLAGLALVATVTSCNNDYEENYLPLPDPMSEAFRPQIHYTPVKNWVNDPNGLVYLDGTYHLFYQYNPKGNDWGNMSWGHATSTDLINWEEQPVAMTRNEWGDIFSGSCVIDKNNTAGFGANAIIALYTGADGIQQECLAYSTDGGNTFEQYNGNPVIKNNDDNLRDPKVFWHEQSQQWIMCLAKGWKTGIEIWGSKNLKEWEQLSIFNVDNPRLKELQWECPDLICMDYEGAKKWVLIVSVNPGGPVTGSGTMYFTGNFDGKNFTADNRTYPLWMDYGLDNYAGVTFSNVAGRNILIGWMNNWDYAGEVPCTPWRSTFTLPRELKLVNKGGMPYLSSSVVAEIENLKDGEFVAVEADKQWNKADAYELVIENFDLTKDQKITLSNQWGNKYVIDFNKAAGKFVVNRDAKSGQTNFHGKFVQKTEAPIVGNETSTTVRIFIDKSSVEAFAADGTVVITNLAFPTTMYDACNTTSGNAKVRGLKKIW